MRLLFGLAAYLGTSYYLLKHPQKVHLKHQMDLVEEYKKCAKVSKPPPTTSVDPGVVPPSMSFATNEG